MRSSTLIILAATLLSATTFKWSELGSRRTITAIYREAKAGRLRTTRYQKAASLAALLLIIVGMVLAFSGD